jgi:hypothetical protein
MGEKENFSTDVHFKFFTHFPRVAEPDDFCPNPNPTFKVSGLGKF